MLIVTALSMLPQRYSRMSSSEGDEDASDYDDGSEASAASRRSDAGQRRSGCSHEEVWVWPLLARLSLFHPSISHPLHSLACCSPAFAPAHILDRSCARMSHTHVHTRTFVHTCLHMHDCARARSHHVPAHRTHVGHACAHTHIRTHTCRARLSARAGLIHTFACTCPHTHVCAHTSVFSWRLIACAVFEYSCVSSRRAVRIRSATRPMTPSLTSRSCVCVRRSAPIRPTQAPPPPPPPSSLFPVHLRAHAHAHTCASPPPPLAPR